MLPRPIHNSRPSLPLLLGLIFCRTALALPEDNQQPINVEADRAEQVTTDKGEKTDYYGNVVISQGSMRLTGKHITIFSQNKTIERLVSIGEPTEFKQQTSKSDSAFEARGKRLEYDLNSNTITVFNDATVIQDGTIMRGERIDYNINTEQVKADSSNKGRVKMVLQPGQNKSEKPQE